MFSEQSLARDAAIYKRPLLSDIVLGYYSSREPCRLPACLII